MKAFAAVAAALVLTVAVTGCHRAKPAPKPAPVVKVVEK
jgi:predicted component of type VI protein secretion system